MRQLGWGFGWNGYGDEGGDFLCGRKNWSRNVALCWKILYRRILLRILSFGSWIRFKIILQREFTNCWLLMINNLNLQWKTSSETNRCL